MPPTLRPVQALRLAAARRQRRATYRRRVEVRSFATLDDGALSVAHPHGFFSTCSVTLVELMRASGPVDRVDFSRALPLYRETPDGCRWDRFFAPPRPPFPAGDPGADLQGLPWSVNSRYRHFDLAALAPWVDAWFRPSEEIRDRAAALATRYRIDPTRTVAVWVRGTDKAQEFDPSSLDRYVRRVRWALRTGGVDRVLVQSDQAQTRDALLGRFGSAAFAVEELPVATGGVGLHFQALPGREDHVFDLLATVVMMSGFRRLVLHTGNGGFWTVLLRGHLRGVAQLW